MAKGHMSQEPGRLTDDLTYSCHCGAKTSWTQHELDQWLYHHTSVFKSACYRCGQRLRIHLDFDEIPPWSNQFVLAYRDFEEV